MIVGLIKDAWGRKLGGFGERFLNTQYELRTPYRRIIEATASRLRRALGDGSLTWAHEIDVALGSGWAMYHEHWKWIFHCAQVREVRRLTGPKYGRRVEGLMNSSYHLSEEHQLYLGEAATQLLGSTEVRGRLRQPSGLQAVLEQILRACREKAGAVPDREARDQLFSFAESFLRRVQDRIGDAKGDTLPALGDELNVDRQTLENESWRLRKAFPPNQLGLHRRERLQLDQELGGMAAESGPDGVDRYAQDLWLQCWRLAFRPGDVGPLRLGQSEAFWAMIGREKPSLTDKISADELADATADVLKFLGAQPNRLKFVRLILGRLVRHEHGLSRRRKEQEAEAIDLVSHHRLSVDLGGRPFVGHEEINADMKIEQIIEETTPARAEAVEIYREAEATGWSVAHLARARGRKPVSVRNNLRHLEKSLGGDT